MILAMQYSIASSNKKRTRRWFAHTFGIANHSRRRKLCPAVFINTKVFSESSESS